MGLVPVILVVLTQGVLQVENNSLTTVEVLERSLALIENPKHHTTGASAKNFINWKVSVDSPFAVKWCAIGALTKISWSTGNASYYARDYLDSTAYGIYKKSIIRVNDDLGHGAVLTVYARAIEAAKAEENSLGDPLASGQPH